MANTQLLKRRIRSVKNTKQITKAMELVAASKMRRATDATVKSREYRNMARTLLAKLREITDVSKHPLFTSRPVQSKLYILVTSDRGLAGAYNSNLYKNLFKQIQADKLENIAVKVITVGKQGGRMMSRIEGIELIGAYNALPDTPHESDITPLLDNSIEMFESGVVDQVSVVFTDFKSTILQEVTTSQILPAVPMDTPIPEEHDRVVVEPSPMTVLNSIARRFVGVQLWQTMLEAQASEQSMRMMAMKSASDNASEIIDDLTLAMNKARQAAITQELAEITAGAEAIK